MRADILKEVASIKMTTDIKPNFSALAADFKASRNTIKRYYNMKEDENPKKKRRISCTRHFVSPRLIFPLLALQSGRSSASLEPMH